MIRIKKQYFLLIICLVFFTGCHNRPVDEPSINTDVEETTLITQENSYISIGEEFHLPILAFHHIANAPAGARANTRQWYISTERFEEILKLLQEQEYTVLFATEAVTLIKEGHLSEKPVIITFDDGAVDFYTNAYPLLKKYNIKATVHLMSGVKSKAWLNETQIKEMNGSGVVEFQSHTQYHEYLTRVDKEDVRRELGNSKKQIEKLTGDPVTVIAYPFGLYNDEVIEVARELGYEAGFTIDRKTNQKIDNLFQLHRVIITEQTNVEKIITIDDKQ